MTCKRIYLGVAGVHSHDSAAALVIDGIIVAAAEEERFTRKKHTDEFPHHSIEFCLNEAGIAPNDVDCVAYNLDPAIRFLPALRFNLSTAYSRVRHILPREGVTGIVHSLKSAWDIERKIIQGYTLVKEYSRRFPRARFVAVNHHDAHAASAFFTSPFQESSVLTVDLIGEWATTRFYNAQDSRLKLIKEINFPDSVGKLYQTFTKFLGFAPNSDEYKVMGLSAYGNEKYVPFFNLFCSLNADGSFTLNKDLLLFCRGIYPEWDKKIMAEIGLPRKPGEPITQDHKDIAYALQRSTEEILIHLIAHLSKETGKREVCLAGGVALNALANQKIRESGLIDKLYIPPAPHDAGTAPGAALFRYFADNPGSEHRSMTTSYLGPAYSLTRIKKVVADDGYTFTNGQYTLDTVLDLLTQGKVVALFQGRMEFGPRALGNRSILADPRHQDMKNLLNSKVKLRESFRPFAPAILEEEVERYFERGKNSPFMTQTFTATPLCLRNAPAVVHCDGTSRIQTINSNSNPRFYDLIQKFRQRTGVPLLVNTSFNLAGEPIVCSPEDALRTFAKSEIDALLLEEVLITK